MKRKNASVNTMNRFNNNNNRNNNDNERINAQNRNGNANNNVNGNGNHNKNNTNNNNNSSKSTNPNIQCFVCSQRGHIAKFCPQGKKGKMNAIDVYDGNDSDVSELNSEDTQQNSRTEAQVRYARAHVSFINVLDQDTSQSKLTVKEIKDDLFYTSLSGDREQINVLAIRNDEKLMKVPGKIESYAIEALLDTGASVSTISKVLVDKLSLRIEKITTKIQTADNKIIPAIGIIRNVKLKICNNTCKIDFLVMDNSYDIICGVNWFKKVAASIFFTEEGKTMLKFATKCYDINLLNEYVSKPVKGSQLRWHINRGKLHRNVDMLSRPLLVIRGRTNADPNDLIFHNPNINQDENNKGLDVWQDDNLCCYLEYNKYTPGLSRKQISRVTKEMQQFKFENQKLWYKEDIKSRNKSRINTITGYSQYMLTYGREMNGFEDWTTKPEQEEEIKKEELIGRAKKIKDLNVVKQHKDTCKRSDQKEKLTH